MRRTILSSVLSIPAVLLCLSATLAKAQSAEGWWQTIDDKTGRVKSIVHITSEKGALTGKIEQLFRKPEEIQDPVCLDCTGDRKNQRIVGMTIIWGMHPAGKGWDNGSILDPGNGKTYRCKLELGEGGNALIVRGYMGISLLGRSQTWKRVPPGSEPKETISAKQP